ncbi:MAG: DNA polymerase III subunit beta [Firmicutes bacterium]|nr:DNA polymerase III subunit beta [Bacillota bacterium]
MKFTCKKDALQNAINIASKAVNPKSTLPILECILIKIGENFVELMSNDMEMAIKTAPIEAETEGEGTAALEAKIFGEIIRRVNGETVTIDIDENKNATIKSGSSEYKIMIQSGDEFPDIPTVEQQVSYKVSQKDLKDVIIKTIFSVSSDESKMALTGELIEISEDGISAVAVDGYRISYKKVPAENSGKPEKVIVPAKTLRELSKILSENDESAEIFITDKHVLFDLEGNILVSRVINGEFIKYEQTFTNDFKTKIVIEREGFISALERASIVGRDSRKVPVKINIEQDSLTITSQSDFGSANEELSVEFEGENIKIAFNPRYLIDALRAIESEKVSVSFNSPLSPCIVRPEEGDLCKYLILPLRM